MGLFGLVAVATAHEHWLKERQDVLAITGPLNAWIDQLPSKTLKQIEKNLAPALFVVGCATVVAPDVILEMRLRAEQNRPAPPRPQSQRYEIPGGPTLYTVAGGAGERNGNASQSASGSPDWFSSVPAGGPVGSEWDV